MRVHTVELISRACLYQRHGHCNHESSTGGLADTEGTGILGQRGIGISRRISCSPENEIGYKANICRPIQNGIIEEQPDEMNRSETRSKHSRQSLRQQEQKGSDPGASRKRDPAKTGSETGNG